MIITKIQGRLGNQLFQYAFTYSQAKIKRTWYIFIFNNYHKYCLPKYFKLREFEKIKIKLANIFYLITLKFSIKYHTQSLNGSQKAIDVIKIDEPNIIWDGHFQSIKYFKQHETEIKNLFAIKKKYIKLFEKKYGEIFNSEKKIALIHIRRTDYIETGNDYLGGKNLTLPMNYYEKCINDLKNVPNIHFLVVSDDVEFVKEYFHDRNHFSFEDNNEIIDFQLIMNSDYLILSNSTFAWWAAFLNERKKMVFAPKYWLGFKIKQSFPNEITDDLNWNLIDVN